MTNVAVVTGGAGGMGLAVAHALGRESTVLISDVSHECLNSAQNELDKAGVDCTAAICDVTDPASVRQLVERAQELGTVVSIIHTARASPSMASAQLILRINAVGTVLINQAFLQIAGRGLAMVNVASVAGHQLPAFLYPHSHVIRGHGPTSNGFTLTCWLYAMCFLNHGVHSLAYVLSKNFVIWYSKALAAQFGSSGARVLSVSPGSFDTAMGRLEASAGAGALARIGALKRFGHTTEIAELLAFCASGKAGYLTGTDIICDGGVMAAMTLSSQLKIARQ